MDAETRRIKRLETKRKMRPLKLKMRRGETLTAEEQKVWDSCQRTLSQIGNANDKARSWLPQNQSYDSRSGASSRNSDTPSTVQGPAGGVRSVVRGGSPGLGKRA